MADKTMTERMQALTESLADPAGTPLVTVAKRKLLGGDDEQAGLHLSFSRSNEGGKQKMVNLFIPAYAVPRFAEAVERNTEILAELDLL